MTEDFDLASIDEQDEAQLAIKHPKTGETTTWVWTFFGPGHPKTIEVANRAARDALREAREKEQAKVNGKKWKAEEQSLDEIRSKNIATIVERTKSFTPVKIAGETIEFSSDAAKSLLTDRRKGWLFSQIIEFLSSTENFIQPSATS